MADVANLFINIEAKTANFNAAMDAAKQRAASFAKSLNFKSLSGIGGGGGMPGVFGALAGLGTGLLGVGMPALSLAAVFSKFADTVNELHESARRFGAATVSSERMLEISQFKHDFVQGRLADIPVAAQAEIDRQRIEARTKHLAERPTEMTLKAARQIDTYETVARLWKATYLGAAAAGMEILSLSGPRAVAHTVFGLDSPMLSSFAETAQELREKSWGNIVDAVKGRRAGEEAVIESRDHLKSMNNNLERMSSSGLLLPQ